MPKALEYTCKWCLDFQLNTLTYMKSSQQKDIIQLEGAIVFGWYLDSRGMSDTVRLNWIHSIHACADVHNSMT